MKLFPHQILLEENEVNVKDLPNELVELINNFDAKLEDFETAEEAEEEEEIKELKKELKALSIEISGEIKEYLEENESSEEEDKVIPKDKEGILRYLYEEGYSQVSIQLLKRMGYPTGPFSKLLNTGERVGKYELKKTASQEEYGLIKHK